MILIIIALLAYAGLVFLRPHFGIYITLLLLPAYQIRFNLFGLPTTFLEWLILILALVTLIKTFIDENLRRSIQKQLRYAWSTQRAPIIAAAVFLIASSIAIAVSPETNKALGLWKAYVAESILFGLLFYFLIDSKKKLSQVFQALGWLVIGLSVFGLYQFFTLYRLPPAWWGPGVEPRRVVSLYTYPNAVSLLITPILAMFTALLALWNTLPQKLFNKKFVIASLALGLTLLILTFSRGAWIGYATSVFFITLFTQHRKLVLGLAMVGAVLILAIPTTRTRLLPVFTGSDPASQERILLYRGTWEIIKTNPIFGTGLYGFRNAYEQIKHSPSDEVLNYPHNFFLNFWVETGIFGLLSIVTILIVSIKTAIKTLATPELKPYALAVLAALIVILVHGQFDVPYFKNDLAVLFWTLIAVVPAMASLHFGESKTG